MLNNKTNEEEMTTAKARTRAYEAYEARNHKEALEFFKIAVKNYPKFHKLSQMHVRDLDNLNKEIRRITRFLEEA